MTQNELRDAARRQPFKPFRVVLTTGATYDIHHPDLIMVGQRSVVLGITSHPGSTVYDGIFQVDLLHIVGVQDLPVNPPSANGPAA